jgi:FKBP-type peptidyl-prolyl cis-trans isomerase 2
VPPEEGFGDHDEELVMEIGRDELPDPGAVAVGDELVAESADGEEAVVVVVDVREDSVIVDGNHPLAGEALAYDVVVKSVRRATLEEIAAAARELEAVDGVEDPPPHLVRLGTRKNGAPGKG